MTKAKPTGIRAPRVLVVMLALAAIAVTLAPAPARAAVVPMTIEQLRAQADAIALVRVDAKHSSRMSITGLAESRRRRSSPTTL